MIVKIKDVRKNYFSLRRGRIEALKGINLEVESGCFYVLLGPSGCGKSTLLNIIAGIEKNNAGEVWIGDTKAASASEKIYLSSRDRDVAMVFQSYALYPHMTVFENMAFPLKIAKLGKKEVWDKVMSSAETLEISELLDAKPSELSGGQRQRVALGRAIVRRPNVLLLDEPLSNLDALLRISMRSELKHIQRRLGVTTIYVTHDQTEAMSMGDKIAVLNEGLVQQEGTPDEIYHDPANLFVAKFMGSPSMNLLSSKIIRYARREIPANQAENIILGIRPEHLSIVEKDNGIFNGNLEMISSLGSEKLLHVKISEYSLMVKYSGESQLKEGSEIGIDFDMNNLYLFDRNSGIRIRD